METAQDWFSPCRRYLIQQPRSAGQASTARCAGLQCLDWQRPGSPHCHVACWWAPHHQTWNVTPRQTTPKLPEFYSYFLQLDNIGVMVIVWRLRGNIIRTAPCWVVWQPSVHSQQHTHMSSSYRSSRLGLSHWDPYAMHRGGCLELYYCNMVEWSTLTRLVWSYYLWKSSSPIWPIMCLVGR